MIGIDLRNTVAVVTGAAGGIGTAISRLLEKAGSRVMAVDMVQPSVGRWVRVDVGNFDEVGRCVQDILAEKKGIDFLINNAGMTRDGVVWNLTEKDWDDVLRVNLKGAFNFIHHTAPQFRARARGRIVNISSINGLRGKFGQANYAASKAGMIALTKSAARELAKSHVTVNAIAPGLIDTPLVQSMPEDLRRKAMDEILLGRAGRPDDVAHAVLFLCSDWAAHITGETIRVDGGQYL